MEENRNGKPFSLSLERTNREKLFERKIHRSFSSRARSAAEGRDRRTRLTIYYRFLLYRQK